MRFLTNGICLAAVTGLLYAGAAFAQPNITTAVVAYGGHSDAASTYSALKMFSQAVNRALRAVDKPVLLRGKVMNANLHITRLRHGRRTCHAQRPACSECALLRMCPYGRELTLRPA